VTAMTTASGSAAGHPGEEPGDWMALHVFYAGNPAPLLSQCVAPLVADLRRRGLIYRYFFIRYWMEGPHTRLRLRPARPQDAAEVSRLAEAAIEDYLRRRPAVYSVDSDMTADLYRQMFVAEYGETAWRDRYGEDGKMPVRENNSYAYIEYEQEYDRYGGPAGVELAEWHFERSSDMVLRLLETTNVHVRTVMFGISAQLTLAMCFTFLGSGDQVADFLEGYGSFWEMSYMQADENRHDLYDKVYGELAGSLAARTAEIRAALAAGQPGELTGFAREWAEHCHELRERVVAAVAERQLVFQVFEDRTAGGGVHSDAEPERERRPAADPAMTLRILLSSYVHMTNNRLGVNIHDEVYLAYLLKRAVLDDMARESSAR